MNLSKYRYIFTLFIIFGLLVLSNCSGFQKRTFENSYQRILKQYTDQQNQQDALFLLNAYDAELTLFRASQIAFEQAYANNIVNYAEKTLNDHEKIMEEIQDVSKDMKVKLHKEPSPRYDAHLTLLETTETNRFDQQYLDFIKEVYQDILPKYKDAAVYADYDDIRTLAARFIKTLRNNRESIYELQDHVSMSE